MDLTGAPIGTTAAQQSAATAQRWLDEGRRVAAGLIVSVDGSAPLPVGACMYIDSEGAVEGSITGGCVESAVAQEALSLLSAAEGSRPRKVTYGISDGLAGAAGLMCGGTVHVFVHELLADDAATRAGLEAVVAGRPSAVATLLNGSRAGAKMFVAMDGTIGTLGRTRLLDHNVERQARGLVAQGTGTLCHFGENGETLGADLGVGFAVNAAARRILIIGAVDFAAALARLASAMGYAVTIADPRTAFLDSPRFRAHALVSTDWPARAVELFAATAGDAVAVFTHDPKLDTPALMAAFASEAGYIAALGSRATSDDRERRLREAGAGDLDLARLFAPAGLDIGAATAEETGLAVLAEMYAVRAGRAGVSLRDVSGSIRHTPEVEVKR